MPEVMTSPTFYKKGKASLGETNEYRLIAREEDIDFFRTVPFIQEPGGITRLVASTDKPEDSHRCFRETLRCFWSASNFKWSAKRCRNSSPMTAHWSLFRCLTLKRISHLRC